MGAAAFAGGSQLNNLLDMLVAKLSVVDSQTIQRCAEHPAACGERKTLPAHQVQYDPSLSPRLHEQLIKGGQVSSLGAISFRCQQFGAAGESGDNIGIESGQSRQDDVAEVIARKAGVGVGLVLDPGQVMMVKISDDFSPLHI